MRHELFSLKLKNCQQFSQLVFPISISIHPVAVFLVVPQSRLSHPDGFIVACHCNLLFPDLVILCKFNHFFIVIFTQPFEVFSTRKCSSVQLVYHLLVIISAFTKGQLIISLCISILIYSNFFYSSKLSYNFSILLRSIFNLSNQSLSSPCCFLLKLYTYWLYIISFKMNSQTFLAILNRNIFFSQRQRV